MSSMKPKNGNASLSHRLGRLTLMALFAAALYTSEAEALDLFGDTLPQAQTNTCQSYAVMLALAVRGDAAFPVRTFDDLRRAERDFRQIAGGIPGGPYSHDALRVAIGTYTNGKYDLRIEDRGDIVQWMTRIKELTTLKSSRDALLADLTGKNFPVVLTSVTRMGSNSYGDGHIVTVLGVAGSGLNSTTELVAFNGAIKGGRGVNRCEPGTQPGDLRYSAGVMSTNDFTLKQYGSVYRILYLQPK